jgi:hypothetical protein
MSQKIITKTSAQAKAERELRNNDCICPECGESCNLPTHHYEGGFLGKQTKVNRYNCISCECEWEVRD